MEKSSLSSPYTLHYQTPDGDQTRVIVAMIRTRSGDVVDDIQLQHFGRGMYLNSYQFTLVGVYAIQYVVYTDQSKTKEDILYSESSEIVNVVHESDEADALAKAVWGARLIDYVTPGSFGLNFQVNLTNSTNTVAELISPTSGLRKILDAVVNGNNEARTLLQSLSSDVFQIKPAISSAKNELLSSNSEQNNILSAMQALWPEYRNQILNQVDLSISKTNELKSLIGTLSNNTTVRFIVPERMIAPVVGDNSIKQYRFVLRLYDELGNPEAPDSTPEISIRSLTNGVVVLTQPMSPEVMVGGYYYTYNIASSTALDRLIVESKITKNGVARYIPAVTEIVEFESDLAEIKNQVNTISNATDLIKIDTSSIDAIKSTLNSTSVKITTLESIVNGVKHDIALLPTTVATPSDITNVISEIKKGPTLYEIVDQLNIIRDQIRGSDNKTLSEIYARIDFSSLMKTSDKRLSFLDAPISSRGTLTAYEVWQYAQRTLTEINIPSSDFAKVWDVFVGTINVPGSIGKRISSYLDVPVSSRSTADQINTGLRGVAQEESIQTVIRQAQQIEVNDMINFRSVNELLSAIRNYVNNIPEVPATESRVAIAEKNLSDLVQNMALVVSAIKKQADKIPANPAKEDTVAKIPNNPILDTDARLSNLDAKISSRATVVDTSHLAKSSEVQSSRQSLEVEIENVRSSLLKQIGIPAQAIEMHNGFNSAIGAINNSKTEIIDKIPQPSGVTLTAKDIWEYSKRELTQQFNFSVDLTDVAKKSDLVNYSVDISAVYRPDSNDQELAVWGVMDGRRVASEDCTIQLKNTSGEVVWSSFSSKPNSNGIFSFLTPIANVLNENEIYCYDISIKINGGLKTFSKSLTTVSV